MLLSCGVPCEAAVVQEDHFVWMQHGNSSVQDWSMAPGFTLSYPCPPPAPLSEPELPDAFRLL
eukprot:15094893-Heterocapsa_arctica.AAC.1